MENKKTFEAVRKKLEYYCAYQERCHQEVARKCQELGLGSDEASLCIVYLLEHNFLNEERFARSFARGKHRIKGWGIGRITNELKQREISAANIKCGLSEISDEEYMLTFSELSERHWETLSETNKEKKRRKFCDFLLRKGWESHLVYEKLKELEAR